MDKEEDDSIDSILLEIEQSLQSGYPVIEEDDNKVFSSYHDDLLTVGYGRNDDFINYNNPFDPRLTFGGLIFGEEIHKPDIKDERYKAEMAQNVFLALDNPSQLMDKYFNGYRTYVRGLSGSPGSGDFTSTECRRLFERISSNSVRSIWNKNSDSPHGRKTPESSIVPDKNQHPRTNHQKTRLTVRSKKTEEPCSEYGTSSNEKQERENNFPRSDVHDNSSQQMSNIGHDECVKNRTRKESTLQKSTTEKPRSTTPKTQNEVTDSWASLFKKKEEKCQANTQPQNDTRLTYCATNKEQTEPITCEQRCPDFQQQSNTNQMNTEFLALQNHYQPNQQLRSTESWSTKQDIDHPNHVSEQQYQFWVDQSSKTQPQQHNQQQQQHQWTGNNNFQQQQQLVYHKPQPTTFVQNLYQHPPPPPGFGQMVPHAQPAKTNTFPTDPMVTGIYNNLQDPQSLLYNLHKYIQQPPPQIQTNQPAKYQYYQSQQKQQAQFPYPMNWNANANNNNSSDHDIYNDENKVSYNRLEMGNEESKDHRDKPRYKPKHVRSNLIRIYPSKEK